MHQRMPGHIPLDLRPRSAAAQLELELLQERACSLGRLGRCLEQTLQALAAFDARHPRSAPFLPLDREARFALVADAAHALWNLAVQREACGLRDSHALMKDYRVPAEVQSMMGPKPAVIRASA